MSKFLDFLRPYRKAIGGFFGGALPFIFTVADAGITGPEWLQVLGAGLAGAGIVYVAPKNKPRHGRDGRAVTERGESALTILAGVALLLLILWLALGLVR